MLELTSLLFKYLDIFGINLIYIKMYTEQNFFVFYDNYLIFQRKIYLFQNPKIICLINLIEKKEF